MINLKKREFMLLKDSGMILPREKMLSLGVSSLTTEELLAIILGRGIKGKDVLELSKEVASFLESSSRMPTVKEIGKIKGLGFAKACQIIACLELSGRFLLASNCPSICTPDESIRRFSFMKYEQQEVFAMISLNSANRVLQTHILTRGTVNQTPIHPREAFVKAIEDRAVAVLFAHNHPSSSLTPSSDDIEVTKTLCLAGDLLGITVLDHLVIGASGYKSIRREYPHLFENI